MVVVVVNVNEMAWGRAMRCREDKLDELDAPDSNEFGFKQFENIFVIRAAVAAGLWGFHLCRCRCRHILLTWAHKHLFCQLFHACLFSIKGCNFLRNFGVAPDLTCKPFYLTQDSMGIVQVSDRILNLQLNKYASNKTKVRAFFINSLSINSIKGR